LKKQASVKKAQAQEKRTTERRQASVKKTQAPVKKAGSLGRTGAEDKPTALF